MSESSHDEDIFCMQRLKNGDDLALNEIMSRWQQRLANYLFRMLGREAEAIDLAQETFVRVYENRFRYVPSAAFSTWLFHIATNLGRDHLRWRARHPTIPLEPSNAEDDSRGEETIAAEALLPSEQMIQKEQAHAVQRAIGTLSPDYRELILLAEYEELSYQEISDILKCSVKAVESRLYRARQSLKDALQNKNGWK